MRLIAKSPILSNFLPLCMKNNIADKRDVLAERKTPATGNTNIIENENVLVDLSMLYDISPNDKNFINKMVKTFLKHMPETLHKLEQGLNNQDWENVYKAAHSAKSSLSIIKIGQMLDWIVQIEENAKNRISLESLPDLVEKIKQKFFFAEEVLKEKFFEKNSSL